jgi:hypothetical protein
MDDKKTQWMNSHKLLATDFDAHKYVLVEHEDGSRLFFRSAFMIQHEGWLYVFTEHNGYHYFHPEDLSYYATFTQDEDAAIDVWDVNGEVVASKRCGDCGKRMPLTALAVYQHSSDPDDFMHYCAPCHAELQRSEGRV